jgi:purine-binding chemotaxis protein CheW
VHEVIELEAGQISPPPRIAMRWRTELIHGMGRRGDDFIIILNIDRVFLTEELALVAEAPENSLAVA